MKDKTDKVGGTLAPELTFSGPLVKIRGEFQVSEGEHRVGISFNPGGHEQVNRIKRIVADLMDYVRKNGKDARCTEQCLNQLEDAAMWGVKSVTKQPRT